MSERVAAASTPCVIYTNFMWLERWRCRLCAVSGCVLWLGAVPWGLGCAVRGVGERWDPELDATPRHATCPRRRTVCNMNMTKKSV